MIFDIPADHRVKTEENEKVDKYLDLARELNNHASDIDNYSSWCTRNSP